MDAPVMEQSDEQEVRVISVTKIKEFQPIMLYDDYRSPEAYSTGGFALTDQAVIDRFRSAFKGLIKVIGK
jgi:hypothetical protein